jgi:hypothetical protein
MMCGAWKAAVQSFAILDLGIRTNGNAREIGNAVSRFACERAFAIGQNRFSFLKHYLCIVHDAA